MNYCFTLIDWMKDKTIISTTSVIHIIIVSYLIRGDMREGYDVLEII